MRPPKYRVGDRVFVTRQATGRLEEGTVTATGGHFPVVWIRFGEPGNGTRTVVEVPYRWDEKQGRLTTTP
jgi:ribosomal protein L35AE/L33A